MIKTHFKLFIFH